MGRGKSAGLQLRPGALSARGCPPTAWPWPAMTSTARAGLRDRNATTGSAGLATWQLWPVCYVQGRRWGEEGRGPSSVDTAQIHQRGCLGEGQRASACTPERPGRRCTQLSVYAIKFLSEMPPHVMHFPLRNKNTQRTEMKRENKESKGCVIPLGGAAAEQARLRPLPRALPHTSSLPLLSHQVGPPRLSKHP